MTPSSILTSSFPPHPTSSLVLSSLPTSRHRTSLLVLQLSSILPLDSQTYSSVTQIPRYPLPVFFSILIVFYASSLHPRLHSLSLPYYVVYETQCKDTPGRTCLFVINWMYEKQPRSELQHVMLNAAAMYKPTEFYVQCPAVNT